MLHASIASARECTSSLHCGPLHTLRDPTELKQIFKDQVFQPDIPMPTITLAEYADYEMGLIAEKEEEKQQQIHEGSYRYRGNK